MRKSPTEPPVLLTEIEAAKMLAVSARTVWGLRNSGEIPFVRVGRCVRYLVTDLTDWISRKRIGGQQ